MASITIPAGSVSGTSRITITPTDDDVVEGDETIVIPGSTDVGLGVSPATITLTDDTSSGAPGDSATLSIASVSSSVAEGGNASFTVTLSHRVDADVTVAWSAPLPADARRVGRPGYHLRERWTFAANLRRRRHAEHHHHPHR